MASYIPQISDNIQETKPQGGGYQFLQQLQPLMDKANQQYEVGKQDVLSGYSSIVNAQVAGPMAEERKRKYVQDAQTKLKTLSKQDLSLPQNVAQAEAAYAPFWEDTDLLENIGAVKTYSKTRSTLESWASSNDADTRAQYSDQSMMDAQRYLEQISMAPLDRNAYRKIEAPKAVRNPHLTAELTNLFESEYGVGADKGISTIQTNGLAMTTLYNGPQALAGYTTYALSKMGDEYNDWFKQKARVTVWEQGREIKALNPTISDQELNTQVAEKRLSELKRYNEKVAGDSNQVVLYYEKLYNAVKQQVASQKVPASEVQEADMAIYENYIQQYKTLAIRHQAAADTEYSPKINGSPNSKYQTNLLGMSTNPQDYLANLYRMQEAEQWAAGKAAITQQKREVDPVQKAYLEGVEKDRRFQLDYNQYVLDVKKANDEMTRANMQYEKELGVNRQGQKIPGYGDALLFKFGDKIEGLLGGSGTPAEIAQNAAMSGTIGRETTEAARIPNYYEVINDGIKEAQKVPELMTVDISSVNGNEGYGAMVLGSDGMGLSTDQMIDFSSAMKKMMGGEEINEQERKTYRLVEEKIRQSVNIKGQITGPYTMNSALRAYANTTVAPNLKLLATKNEEKAASFMRLGLLSAEIEQKLLRSKEARVKLDEATANEILNKDEYSSLTYMENGKKKLADRDYIASKLVSGEARNLETGKVEKLNKKDIADAYGRGQLKVTKGSYDRMSGGDYYLQIDNRTYAVSPYDPILGAVNSVINQYGTSEEVHSIKKRAGQKVAEQLQMNPDGVITKSMSFTPESDPTKGGSKKNAIFFHNYLTELSRPENTSDFYEVDVVGGKKVPITDKATIKAIRDAMIDPDRSKNIAMVTDKVDSELMPAGEIVFRSAADAGIALNQTAGDPLSKLRGKSIIARKTPNAQGNYINAIPSPILNESWGGLYRGDIIESTPIQNATGYRYKAYPVNKDPNGNYTAVEVEITMKVYKNGKFVEETKRETKPLTGSTKIMADELQSLLMQYYSIHTGNQLAEQRMQFNKPR